MGIGGWIVFVLLSVLTMGILLPFLAWDFLRRANAIGRNGIHTYLGVLPWSELTDASVHTVHSTKRGRIVGTVHFARLAFRSRTIDVGPWGAPRPRLVLRALAAGVGRALDVPQPSGRVKWTRDEGA